MILTPLGFAAPTFADIGYPYLPLNMRGVKRAAIKAWFCIVGPHCPCCGREMRVRRREFEVNLPWFATIDHLVACALGGAQDDGSNLWVICHGCNNVKSQGEFMVARGFAP